MNPDPVRSMLYECDDEDYGFRDYDDGLDENLMGDEDDRSRLAQMTDMQREQELISRKERRKSAKIRYEIEQKLKLKTRKRADGKRPLKQFESSIEDSTFSRSESIKSNSLLRLSDMRKHGLQALYKGLSSELLVKGFTLGAETVIANYIDWPREVGDSKRYLEDSFKVLALKAMSIALSTPLLCSSAIETVQSAIVVRDRPSFIDCLRDGFFRLLHLRPTSSNRLIPIWLLVVPTVFYHLSHTILTQFATKALSVFRRDFLAGKRKGRKCKAARKNHSVHTKHSIFDNTKWQPEDLTANYDPNETNSIVDSIEIDSEKISTSIMARLMADVALLPIEIVLNCLYIQGTRTIIDNCDETTVVLPVLTNYDGFTDCYQSILRFEGNMGLYKGLGAIVLQYSVHYVLFRSLYYLLREFQFKSDSSENAPRLKSTHSQQASGSVEDLLVRLESNRHSTPNNPALRNRISDSELESDETPKRFSRI